MDLYHGTDKKLDTIEPMGVNMGMRFQNPRWSSYWWADEELAIKWAVFQTIRRLGHVKVRYDVSTGTALCDIKDRTQLYRECSGAIAYVYKTTVAVWEVSIGSSPEIDEYTLDKPVRPSKRYTISIGNAAIDQYVSFKTSSEIDVYLNDLEKGKFANRRNILMRILLDRNKDRKRGMYMKKLHTGELKPGDKL